MSEQTGYVYFRDHFAGTLRKVEGRFFFEYDEKYLTDPSMPSISITLPKRLKKFESDILFPFFYGLLAEGELKKLQCRLLKIDEKDHFKRLLETAGEDTIGAITVKKNVA